MTSTVTKTNDIVADTQAAKIKAAVKAVNAKPAPVNNADPYLAFALARMSA